jgi:hypothetical protein
MAKRRSSSRAHGRSRDGERGVEPAVVSVARREPVDVPRALRRARKLASDDELAVALVDMAYDVDATTIMPFIDAVKRLKDEQWRARTLFSAVQQFRSEFTKSLPAAAQDVIVALVQGIGHEPARAVLMRKLPAELPESLRARLAGLAAALPDPVIQLETLIHLDRKPSDETLGAWLDAARRIDDQEKRARALATIAARLSPGRLAEAFAAARAIDDPGAAGLALVHIAHHFRDADARERAHLEIVSRVSSIGDPIRRFDVLAALRDLPADSRRTAETTLFELAVAFEDAALRCRAMFVVADFAQDEVLRKNALLAGIAAAERVPEPRARGELLALLRPAGPWLDPAVRAELRRAVDRVESREVQRELRSALSRIFVVERPSRPENATPAAPPRRRERRWDVFVSYATVNVEEARSLASELRSRGLQVFLSADTLDAEVGSAGWVAAIDKALEGTGAMLVVVTREALASKWVAEEWRKYYRLMVDNQSGRLFSLRLSGPPIAELPLTLRNYQVIDSPTGRLEPGHFTRIFDLVRGR